MSKLFIISNRLPLTIEKNGESYRSRQSSGGLVSAINAYLGKEENSSFTRKIWTGVSEHSENIWSSATSETEGDYEFRPVFVGAKLYEQYYNGFSNSVTWPLFHYFPSFADYQPVFFDAYMKVNERFVESLEKVLDIEDTVWIHDYHLLPLAGMLRRKFPTLTIGFFLHIPFPSYELFRLIPRDWQRELLLGMLGADVIGFHTREYADHFLGCAERVLRIATGRDRVTYEGRDIQIKAIPIGIDFQLFNEAATDRRVLLKRSEFLRSKQDKKLIFSVDRLDYTKGVFNRLKGYREFLIQNPGYWGKVVFALVIVPSRDNISKYAERKKMIDEYIGNFNSRLGNISWQPVIYQYGHLSFEELVGLYTACDVALITPLRDGMNLVAKEFIASRKDRHGVLVLSEMAGAAEELTEALLINPNDSREIAAMIRTGLEMSIEEQEQRISAMQNRLRLNDVISWARSFFEALEEVKAEQATKEPKLLDNFARSSIIKAYNVSRRRLLLLDYDGTLAPFCADPQLASPSAPVLQVLSELASDPHNDIYVVSGRDSQTLGNWLEHLPIGLIAEHGLKHRPAGGEWIDQGQTNLQTELASVEQLMQQFTEDCPGSFIEHKKASIAWHYRKAESSLGVIKAGQLYHLLSERLDRTKLNVLNGHKVIEVKGAAVNKGAAVAPLINNARYDFVLCAGDDQTDEDMFRVLKGVTAAFTIKVGSEPSFAAYNLLTPYLVLELLERLAEYKAAVKQFEISSIN